MGHKGGEHIWATTPDEKNVIDISVIKHNVLGKRIFGPGISLLPVVHGQVGIYGGKISPYSCAFKLQVKLVKKCKIIVSQTKINRLDQKIRLL